MVNYHIIFHKHTNQDYINTEGLTPPEVVTFLPMQRVMVFDPFHLQAWSLSISNKLVQAKSSYIPGSGKYSFVVINSPSTFLIEGRFISLFRGCSRMDGRMSSLAFGEN